MPNKHSEFALQRRIARRIIFNTAYHDLRRCETVCQVSRPDVIGMMLTGPSAGTAYVLASGEPVQVSLVPDVVKGEVLVDSRGQGSFQR